MSRPRRKVFGPLFYSALLAWGLVALYGVVEVARPRVETWLHQRAILNALRSPNLETRRGVVLGLESESPAFARTYLVEALGDPSLAVRIAACRSLAQQGYEPQTLIPILSAAADDEQVETREETTHILSRIMALAASKIRSSADGLADTAVQARSGTKSVLCRLLKDRVPEVRGAAVDALGETGLNSSVATELIAAADDPDRGVRLAIARALLRINGPSDRAAAGILTSLVADREPVGDRSMALQTLLQTSEDTRNQALLAMVELLSHSDPVVQPDVLDCLGEAGPHARVALPALEKLLDDPEPSTRAAAVRAILKIETGWSTPGPGMMGGAAAMMGGAAVGLVAGSDESKNNRLSAVMIEMIADKTLSEEWRMEMLGRIKETTPASLVKATPGLIRQLGDPNPNLRRSALALLGNIIEDTPAQMPH